MRPRGGGVCVRRGQWIPAGTLGAYCAKTRHFWLPLAPIANRSIPRFPSIADVFIGNSNLTGGIGVFVVGSISGQRPSLDG